MRARGDAALVPATEILIPNPALRRALRENETHLIYGMLETGRAAGMHTLEQSLAGLVRQRRLSPHDAMTVAVEPAALGRLIGRAGVDSETAFPESCGAKR